MPDDDDKLGPPDGFTEIDPRALPEPIRKLFEAIRKDHPEVQIGAAVKTEDLPKLSGDPEIAERADVANKLRVEIGKWALDKIDAGNSPAGINYALTLTAVAMFFVAARGQRGRARDQFEELIDESFDNVESFVDSVPGLRAEIGRTKDGKEITAVFAKLVEAFAKLVETAHV